MREPRRAETGLDDLGVSETLVQFWAGLRPRDLLRVNRWADRHRVLPGTASTEPGPWRTARNPPLREIMEVLSHDHPAKDVVVVSPTQWGKSEILINLALSNMDQAPGPILIVQPTIADGRKFVNLRLDPSLQAIPRLFNKLGSQKTKSKKKGDGDSNFQKLFPGGSIMVAWSNSASALSSVPIRVLALDEVDKYAFDADGQGDPVDLAVARTENFPNCKRLFISSPANAVDSRIWPRFLAGDQRLFFVPCWGCGALFFMDWDLMEWEKDSDGEPEPGSIRVRCPHCSHHNEEHRKTSQLEAGAWIPQNPRGAFPSFRINALYKPLGWGSWAELVAGYRQAKRKGIQSFKVWHNTKRALPWEEEATKAEPVALFSRREIYQAEIPEGVLMITAGVDVQDDRLEAEVVGWGRGLENWGIERITIWGDTSGRAPWEDLDQWLRSSWERQDGQRQWIAATGVDSLGHRTEEVYKFCKPREARRIWPFYGRGGPGLPILGRVTKRHRSGVYLFPLGADTCKDEILASLLVEEVGPRYCHFPLIPSYDEEFFKQLTAESKLLIFKENRQSFVWRKTRERNEALDIRQLARAVLETTAADLDTMPDPYLAAPAEITPPRPTRTRSRGVAL